MTATFDIRICKYSFHKNRIEALRAVDGIYNEYREAIDSAIVEGIFTYDEIIDDTLRSATMYANEIGGEEDEFDLFDEVDMVFAADRLLFLMNRAIVAATTDELQFA